LLDSLLQEREVRGRADLGCMEFQRPSPAKSSKPVKK